jgi:hypothetical protein
MRRIQVVAAIALVGLAVAGLALAGMNNNSSIHLTGQLEVPINDSKGQGQAIFRIAADGESIDYRLIAANIENVVVAHIHCAGPGVNGPVTVFLYGPVDAGGGRTDGVLSAGTITAADVRPVADSATCPGGIETGDLDAVIALLQNGGGYVNVHTNDGVAPTNTGPGDLAAGEIRGDT